VSDPNVHHPKVSPAGTDEDFLAVHQRATAADAEQDG
jgi:hypothetical protein